MNLAPIALFTFKRLDLLRTTVDYLRLNRYAEDSDLYIFSDGCKKEADEFDVRMVREYIKTVRGFKSVTILESVDNKGLAKSIIGGVTEILNEHGRIIVLEDDLQTSKNFLSFMNQGLEFYEKNPLLFSVAGFSIPIKGLSRKEVYFSRRASSWGWATWIDRWEKVDWEVLDFKQFQNDKQMRRSFNEMGSDMTNMLNRQMSGKLDSWAIRWCYHQFKKRLYTVHPAASKVRNIGFRDSLATHTKEKYNRFDTNIDESDDDGYRFFERPFLDDEVIDQFTAPFSLLQRIKYKILNNLF